MNEHITEYCRNFIESPENPRFALFINGPWGSGKTYFINKLLEKYSDENQDNDTDITQDQIIKISLFGVKSTEDIDLKIYQAIHPILSSKTMQIVGSVIRSAIKMGTSIDINGNGKEDLSISTDGLLELKSGDKVSKISKKLLIVDDIERCILPPSEIFGYFSEIITESETKVIFIGNEESISEEDITETKKIKVIKEKTIGLEFTIEPDFESACEKFFLDLAFSEDTKKCLRKILIQIITYLDFDNLRIIWQALYNLKLILNSLDEILEDEDKEIFITTYLMLNIQKSLNWINKDDDFRWIISAYFKDNCSYPEYKKRTEGKEQTFFFYGLMEYIPLFEHWRTIIFNNIYTKEKIKEIYQKEKKELKGDERNLYQLLRNWRTYDKDKFKQKIETVTNELAFGVYIHPGEILHYSDIMFIFSNWKLIPDTKEQIKERVSEVIKNKKLHSVSDWASLEMGYNGFGYNLENTDLKEILLTLKENNKGVLQEDISKKLNNDIELLGTDTKTFCRKLTIMGTNEYYRFPVLAYIDIQKFYEKLSILSAKDLELCIYALENRYGKKESDGNLRKEYYSDLENLKILASKFNDENLDITYNPKLFFRRNARNKLNELISYFEEKMKY